MNSFIFDDLPSECLGSRRKVAYVCRVNDWVTTNYKEELEKCDLVFYDKIDLDPTVESEFIRDEYDKMRETLNNGDTLVIIGLYELERYIPKLLYTLTAMYERGVNVNILQNNVSIIVGQNNDVYEMCNALLGFLEWDRHMYSLNLLQSLLNQADSEMMALELFSKHMGYSDIRGAKMYLDFLISARRATPSSFDDTRWLI